MILPSVIKARNPFLFEAAVAYDVHVADFNIELVLFDADTAASATEDDPADFAVYAQ